MRRRLLIFGALLALTLAGFGTPTAAADSLVNTSTASPHPGGAGVLHQGKTYYFGGASAGGVCTSESTHVVAYDPGTDTRSTQAPLPTPLAWARDAGAGSYNGKIYVMGGCYNDGCFRNTNTVYEYDPATQLFSVKLQYASPTSLFEGYVQHGRYIYLFGGASFSCPMGSSSDYAGIWRYDMALNLLQHVGSLPYGRSGIVAVSDGVQHIYLMGGSQTNEIRRFDTVTNTVSDPLAHFATARYRGQGFWDGLAAFYVGGMHYADNQWTNEILRFSPASGELKLMRKDASLYGDRPDAIWDDFRKSAFVSVPYGAPLKKYKPVDDPVSTYATDTAPNAAGWWRGPVRVTLSATGDHTHVEYRLNPTKGAPWVPYSSPIDVLTEGGNVLEYRAVNPYGVPETTKSASIKIDSQVPTSAADVTKDVIGLNDWSRGDAYLRITATDAAGGSTPSGTSPPSYYRVEPQSTNVPYPGTAVKFGNDGLHRVWYHAEDVAGNVEAEKLIEVKVDKTLPASTVTLSPARPASGWYSGVTVEFKGTCQDATSGPDRMESSWDNVTWTPYAAGTAIHRSEDGVHRFHVRCFDKAGNQGNVAVQEAKLDSTRPAVTLTHGGTKGNNDYYVGDVTLTLGASDNGGSGITRIQYSIPSCSGPSWQDYVDSAKPKVTVNGQYAPCGKADDVAGNAGTASSSTFKIDRTAPRTVATRTAGTAGSGDWWISTVRVKLDVYDDAASFESGVAGVWYRVLLNNAEVVPWTRTTAGTSVDLDRQGSNKLQFYGEDVAGNKGLTQEVVYPIDTVKPTHSVTLSPSAAPSGWVLDCVSAAITADDATSGVANVRWKLDATEGDWPAASPPSTCAGGSHALTTYAVDVAGNRESPDQIRSFKIDREKPTCAVAVGGGTDGLNGWKTTAPTGSVTASDPTPGSGLNAIYYRIERTGAVLVDWTPIANGGSFPIDREGALDVKCYATDVAGWSGPVDVEPVKVDLTDPSSSASASGTNGLNGWYTGCVTVTITASDSASGVDYVEYRFGSAAWQRYAGPFTYCDEGSGVLEYRSVDKAGRVETSKTTTLKLDLNDPDTKGAVVSGSKGGNGWWISDVSVELTCSDGAGSGCSVTKFKRNGVEGTYAPPSLLIGTEGANTLQNWSVDVSGRTEAADPATSYKIDKTKPSASHALLGTLGRNGWYVSDVTVRLSATDATSGVDFMEYVLDGGPITRVDGPFPHDLLVPEESLEHTLQYRATDRAGLVSDWSTTYKFKIDKTAPVTDAPAACTPRPTGWCLGSVSQTLTCREIVNLSGCDVTMYSVNGGAWTAYTAPIAVNDGLTVIAYYSEDKAGNEEKVKTVEIRVDNLPPETKMRVGEPNVTDSSGNVIVGPFTPICLDATDGASGVNHTYYRVNDGNIVEYVACFKLTDGTGTKSIVFWSVDKAGNEEDRNRDQNRMVVQLDVDGPDSRIVRPTKNSMTVDSVMLGVDPLYLDVGDLRTVPEKPLGIAPREFVIVAESMRVVAYAKDDKVALREVRFMVNGTTWATVPGSESCSSWPADHYCATWEAPAGLAAGNHTLSIVGVDFLGNEARVDLTFTLVAAPVVEGAAGTEQMTSNMIRVFNGMDQCTPAGWRTSADLLAGQIVDCVKVVISKHNEAVRLSPEISNGQSASSPEGEELVAKDEESP